MIEVKKSLLRFDCNKNNAVLQPFGIGFSFATIRILIKNSLTVISIALQIYEYFCRENKNFNKRREQYLKNIENRDIITACILGGLRAAWRSSSSSTSSGMSAEVSFTKRAAAELSRCFNGISVSRQNKNKATNNDQTTSTSTSKDINNKPLINETTQLINSKICGKQQISVNTNKNSNTSKNLIKQGFNTPTRGPRTGQTPPKAPPKTWRARRKNYLLSLPKAKYLDELWTDVKFLAKWFAYFTPLERCVLAQVITIKFGKFFHF